MQIRTKENIEFVVLSVVLMIGGSIMLWQSKVRGGVYANDPIGCSDYSNLLQECDTGNYNTTLCHNYNCIGCLVSSQGIVSCQVYNPTIDKRNKKGDGNALLLVFGILVTGGGFAILCGTLHNFYKNYKKNQLPPTNPNGYVQEIDGV